jgi:hypothetical protein
MYQIKINGAQVGNAQSNSDARAKAFRMAMDQVKWPVDSRCEVQVWRGRYLVTTFGPAFSS